jgi:hypothetical protein
LSEVIAGFDTRIFFHEDGVNVFVRPGFSDEVDLMFNGFSRVFVVARAVADDEEGAVFGRGSVGSRESGDHVCGTRKDHSGHAGMSSHRTTVMDSLRSVLLGSGEIRDAIGAQTQFSGDDLFGEIPFADE